MAMTNKPIPPDDGASADRSTDAGNHGSGHHQVTITVNKQPVVVEGPRPTGGQIKAAAITAGLPIEMSFILSQLQPNGRYKNVGDDEPVTVNKTSVFRATADDDDS